MARTAIEGGRTSIRHACQTFQVSETCYRYQAKACEENATIADWLVRLTTCQATPSFTHYGDTQIYAPRVWLRISCGRCRAWLRGL